MANPQKSTTGSKRRPRARRVPESASNRPSAGDLTRDYQGRLRACTSLAGEIDYILRDVISASGVKTHEISTRVKELDSALRKIFDKGYESLDRVHDLVGARVVCLFRSDLTRIKVLIDEHFEVIEFDDKFISDPDAFGYMSLHFMCRLKQHYNGPRYDTIKSVPFEIQLRTICMHAWSAVQHYLEYKGDWDAPDHLKKDLNALSGLFYVADTQFEAVYGEKVASAETARKNVSSRRIETYDINLDTLVAYMRARFPDRMQAPASYASDLIQELHAAGYKTIGDIAKDVDRGLPALDALEKKQSRMFQSVGAIRMCLGMASPKYRAIKYRPNDTDFTDYQHLVAN